MITLTCIDGGKLMISPDKATFYEGAGSTYVYTNGRQFHVKETFSDIQDKINAPMFHPSFFAKNRITNDEVEALIGKGEGTC